MVLPAPLRCLLTQARWSEVRGIPSLAEDAVQRVQSRGSPPLPVQVKVWQHSPRGIIIRATARVTGCRDRYHFDVHPPSPLLCS